MSFQINPGEMTLRELRLLYRERAEITLNNDAWGIIRQSRKVVDKITDEGQTVYGINTGFGLLAQTSIPEDQLELLQTNLSRRLTKHSFLKGLFLRDSFL